jgi:hypothetical protein
LERQGIPSALICTVDFAHQARFESQYLAMPEIPITAVPHPLAGNDPDVVRKKAMVVVDEIIHVLTAPADKLGEEYRSRYLKFVKSKQGN